MNASVEYLKYCILVRGLAREGVIFTHYQMVLRGQLQAHFANLTLQHNRA